MDRQQFKTWASDFKARFPSTGDWLINLPDDTRNLWFEEVFSMLELADCVRVNRELMKSGELEAYQREKMPTIFFKRCQEIEYERDQVRLRRLHEKRNADRQRRGLSFTQAILSRFDPCMLRAYDEVVSAMQSAKKRGEPMSGQQIRDLAGRIMDEYDTNEDDELSSVTYKCLSCRDSGFVSYRDPSGRPFAGACDCSAGDKRRESFKLNGKTLGRTSQNVATEWEVHAD